MPVLVANPRELQSLTRWPIELVVCKTGLEKSDHPHHPVAAGLAEHPNDIRSHLFVGEAIARVGIAHVQTQAEDDGQVHVLVGVWSKAVSTEFVTRMMCVCTCVCVCIY